jgi:hypothetical protein
MLCGSPREPQTALTEVIGKGKAAARKIKHATVLLKLEAPNQRHPQHRGRILILLVQPSTLLVLDP